MNATPKQSAPKPKALVFDWDNTLVDSWGTIHAALAETFEAMGHVPWTLEETRQRVRYSMRESFPKLFGDEMTEAKRLALVVTTGDSVCGVLGKAKGITG